MFYNKTLYQCMRENALNYSDHIAITDANAKWSYKDLDFISNSYAKYLVSQGASHGSKILIQTNVSKETMALIYAVLKIGAVGVLLPEKITEENIQYATQLTKPLFMIKDAKKIIGSSDDLSMNISEFCETVDVHESGLVLFTSGTTSKPKGVFLSQYQLLNNANVHRDFMKLTQEDKIVACLPLNHILGIVITVIMPVVATSSTHICENIHTKTVLDVIEKNRCSILCGVPTMYHALINKEDIETYDLSCLRFGLTGGAGCSAPLFKQIEEVLNITLVSTLGQTETTGGYTIYSPKEQANDRYNTVGIPSPLMDVRIKDKDGHDLENGTQGEICVKGPLVTKGYINQPEETALLIDENGWLHSGDLGYFDENGFLRVSGRMKNIIIRSGENISAAEIESKLGEDNRIKEVKVIGVPDEHRGEEVCACIVSDDKSLTIDDILAFAKTKMEERKLPRYVVFFDEFPKTDIGKIRQGELKKTVEELIRTKHL